MHDEGEEAECDCRDSKPCPQSRHTFSACLPIAREALLAIARAAEWTLVPSVCVALKRVRVDRVRVRVHARLGVETRVDLNVDHDAWIVADRVPRPTLDLDRTAVAQKAATGALYALRGASKLPR